MNSPAREVLKGYLFTILRFPVIFFMLYSELRRGRIISSQNADCVARVRAILKRHSARHARFEL